MKRGGLSCHSPPIEPANLLLRALSEADHELLAPHLHRVTLEQDQVLAAAGEPISHVYFPEGGVISITAKSADGVKTEVGIFGREGMSGMAVALGADQSPQEVFVQVDGTAAQRIEAGAFRSALGASATLQAVLLRFVQTLLLQSAQSLVANAHLTIEARLARWLIMCHDRIDGDEIRLTHQFMSMMIAAQRTGVTLTLHILEGAGIIRSQRGRVTVLDRERLQELAGDSYGQAEAEYRRLIGPFGG